MSILRCVEVSTLPVPEVRNLIEDWTEFKTRFNHTGHPTTRNVFALNIQDISFIHY